VRKKAGKQTKQFVQIIPPAGWREKQLAHLGEVQFAPHDLTEIVQEPDDVSKEQEALQAAVIEFRRQNELQINQLLCALGFDPADPDWQRAFFKLAMIHHGVGHLARKRARPRNKNASEWTSEQNLIFYQIMLELKAEGLSERAAVRKIAADPTKWPQFSPRVQNRPSSNSSEVGKRFAKFWRQWIQVIKTAAEPGSLLRAIVGDYPVSGTDKQQDTWITDSLNSAPGLVKIKAD
jgi:hypothetical protein